MTCELWEWFNGRYEDDLTGPNDPGDVHPVWKRWWFLLIVAAMGAGIAWYSWPVL